MRPGEEGSIIHVVAAASEAWALGDQSFNVLSRSFVVVVDDRLEQSMSISIPEQGDCDLPKIATTSFGKLMIFTSQCKMLRIRAVLFCDSNQHEITDLCANKE